MKWTAKQKFAYVMREFKKGKLRTRGNRKVTDRKQAVAIAYSEARKISPRFGK